MGSHVSLLLTLSLVTKMAAVIAAICLLLLILVTSTHNKPLINGLHRLV